MQHVPLVLVLNKDINDGLKQVLLNEIHHKSVVLCPNYSLKELYNRDIEDFRLKTSQI